MAWKDNEAQQIQRDAVMAAIKAAREAAGQDKKHVTASEAYEHYTKQALPEPVTHFSNRRFLDYVHRLADEKLVKCMTVSRGRHGAALMIEILGSVSQ